MAKKRITMLFLLLVAAGSFQAGQLYRIQSREQEKWAALAVRQRLESLWREKDGAGEIVVVVDAHGRPLPGMPLKYRTSPPEEAANGLQDLVGRVWANFPFFREEK